MEKTILNFHFDYLIICLSRHDHHPESHQSSFNNMSEFHFFRCQIFQNQTFFWHKIFQNQNWDFFSRPYFLKPSIIWHKPQNPNVTLWSEKQLTRFVSIKTPELNMKLEMTLSDKIAIKKYKCNWRLGMWIGCVLGTGVATALRK